MRPRAGIRPHQAGAEFVEKQRGPERASRLAGAARRWLTRRASCTPGASTSASPITSTPGAGPVRQRLTRRTSIASGVVTSAFLPHQPPSPSSSSPHPARHGGGASHAVGMYPSVMLDTVQRLRRRGPNTATSSTSPRTASSSRTPASSWTPSAFASSSAPEFGPCSPDTTSAQTVRISGSKAAHRVVRLSDQWHSERQDPHRAPAQKRPQTPRTSQTCCAQVPAKKLRSHGGEHPDPATHRSSSSATAMRPRAGGMEDAMREDLLRGLEQVTSPA